MKRTRLTKIAKIVDNLDRLADDIQPHDERVALHLDHVSDMMEKTAFNPQGWLPGRGPGPGRGHGFGMGWRPGIRWKLTPPGNKPDPGGFVICPSCGTKIRVGSGSPRSCPNCGSMVKRASFINKEQQFPDPGDTVVGIEPKEWATFIHFKSGKIIGAHEAYPNQRVTDSGNV